MAAACWRSISPFGSATGAVVDENENRNSNDILEVFEDIEVEHEAEV